MLKTGKVSEIYKRRLGLAMEKKGFTNFSLAKEAGISHQALYGYLEGERLPRLDYLVAISEALGVSCDWLVGRRGVKHGAWLPQGDTLGEMCQCSECGTLFRNFSQDKYCRECGAKMDGGTGK